MKKIFTKHNAVLVFSIFLTTWAVYSFFSWHLKPLPQKIPAEIVSMIDSKGYFGEPVFLSSQLMDEFVLNHPDLNIFPAGGDTLSNAKSIRNFYIIESFQPLKCSTISKDFKEELLLSSNGYALKKCNSSKIKEEVINASSFLEKFIVTVSPSIEPVMFRRGSFKTGHNGWQKIEVGSAEFNNKNMMAISAHPLPENKKIIIEIPSIDKNTSKITIGYGIADSGKHKGSKPVEITVLQLSNEIKIHSSDGKWIEKKLSGFSSFEPITVTISVEKSGKRHFFFDIRYFLETE